MISRVAVVLILLLAPSVASAESIVEPEPDDVGDAGDPDAGSPDADAEPDPDPIDLQVAEVPADEPADAADREPTGGSSLADDLRTREELRPWHIAFGTASVASMYATTILGYLTYSDQFGFDGPLSSGCASSSSIFGADYCRDGVPFGHAIAALTATTLFSVTFSLALFMPDPLGAGDGDGELATMLTIHRALRWGLAGLFVTQLVLGFVSALALESDFNTRRDVATAHLALGTITTAGMTTQGILGSLMAW